MKPKAMIILAVMVFLISCSNSNKLIETTRQVNSKYQIEHRYYVDLTSKTGDDERFELNYSDWNRIVEGSFYTFTINDGSVLSVKNNQ